jgi:hypothetical protein
MRLKAPRTGPRLLPLGLLVALFASCGVSKNSGYWRTIEAYRTAAPREGERSGSTSRWDLRLTLPSGTHVAVKACLCGPSDESRITLHYSDEKEAHVVYAYKDYLYPADLRIEGGVMHAKVSGVAGGIWPQTKLIVYDLVNRKKLREIRVDAKDVE